MPECINLDDLSVDSEDCLNLARKLEDEIEALSKQRDYLREKAKAMYFRKEGKIQEAEITERFLEHLYKRLPKELQW